MAGKTATLALKITGDTRDGVRALDEAEGRASRFGSVMGGAVAAGAAAGVVAIGLLGKASFDAASALEQSTGAIDSVFGDWAIDIEQSAQAADKALGLSASAYENLAAVIGAQLSGAGFAHAEMTKTTQGLIEKGADLAATFGGTTADAVSALSSVLKGETDPIERYGVSIKQADISARLAALGQDKLTGTALKTATANAALALVTEQTASATGAFARESDTAAGSSARLSAWWENLKAKMGAGLLPIFVAATGFFTEKLSPALDKLTAQGGPLATALATVGEFVTTQVLPALASLWESIGPQLGPAFDQISSMMSNVVVPAFYAVWNIINTYVVPMIKTILVPALEGARSMWASLEDALERNKGKFSEILEKVRPLLEFLRDTVAPFVGGALKLAFEGFGKVLGGVIDSIVWILDKATDLGGVVGDVVGFLNPFGAANPGGAPAPAGAAFGAARLFGATPGGLFAAASSSPPGGTSPSAGRGLALSGDTYQITVNGALDPVAVADQIERMLNSHARRTGRLLAGSVR